MKFLPLAVTDRGEITLNSIAGPYSDTEKFLVSYHNLFKGCAIESYHALSPTLTKTKIDKAEMIGQ
jgi:hypothetical protein